MTNFEKWEDRYKRNWCTKDQLKRLVELKVLTVNEEKDEYKLITGEDYGLQR